VAYALSHLGLQRSTATNAALLVTIEPVSLILLSPLVLGLTVTVLPHWRGDLLLVLSAVAFASYSLFGRDVLARWDARTVTARSIVWGAASMVPLAALEWASGTRPAWTPAGAAATIYLAVVVTALAYLAWNYGLSLVSAPRAAIFINVQPVVGVVLGVLLLGETATMATLAGAVLVIAGLVVTGVRL